jgi:Kef-type K+ transport system membrane component KefB
MQHRPDLVAVLGQTPLIVMQLRQVALFFMFVAGLEVNPAYLQKRGRSVVGTSLLGIVLPGGLGLGTVLLLPDVWGAPAQEHLLLFALFIGVALSISALPVIARILLDLALIRDEIGVTVLAAATINDLIGWSLFAMLLGSFGQYSTTAPLGIMALTTSMLSGPVMQRLLQKA